jgi:hypothetical protein
VAGHDPTGSLDGPERRGCVFLAPGPSVHFFTRALWIQQLHRSTPSYGSAPPGKQIGGIRFVWRARVTHGPTELSERPFFMGVSSYRCTAQFYAKQQRLAADWVTFLWSNGPWAGLVQAVATLAKLNWRGGMRVTESGIDDLHQRAGGVRKGKQ